LHFGPAHNLVAEIAAQVLGAIILTAVLAPDLARYARNDRNAMLSELEVVVGFPAMLFLAAIPAAIYGKHDLMDVMILLQIPGIAIVVPSSRPGRATPATCIRPR
jgi:purine-cytosine permease-like protein